MSFRSQLQIAAAALQAALHETVAERNATLLRAAGSNSSSNRQIIATSERLALLRHLKEGLRLLAPPEPGDQEAHQYSCSQLSAIEQDFKVHQLWCDGTVLYRVESSPRSRHCCQLVPVSGREGEPLRRTWHNTSGLRRVA
ncbi:MAG: hypothetical protein K9J75_02050 [Cyanobium usitatum Tobar12.5m-G36]|nr:hypothetical protein [Cyanobium usitatum Tobar12.5m-G36]